MKTNRRDHCKSLYKEYIKLKKKTRLEAKNHRFGKKVRYQYLDQKEVLKARELKEKLLQNCKSYLNDEELFEIEN